MAKKVEGGESSPNTRVGYKRPPEEHRFKEKQVSNPWGCKGKPKPAVDFLDELQRLVIDGVTVTLSRDQAIDYSLYQEALQGNVSAAKELEARQQRRRLRQSSEQAEALTPEQLAAIKRAVLREARSEGRLADDADEPDGGTGGEGE